MVEISSLRQLAATVRGRRTRLGLSQAELADRARVSRQWVNEFEAGKATAELGLTLRLLHALDLRLELSPDGTTPAAAEDSDALDLDAVLGEILAASDD